MSPDQSAPRFVYPPKPAAGDTVAVLSPSAGLPGRFPLPFELGLSRLRESFGLVPAEYPTSRVLGAPPADRARDVNAAFADPAVKAVIASIGGEDQLKVLPYLDAELIAANPKPFFGFSDNTNLHLFLWRLGIVSYSGGSVMTEFGRPGRMHPLSLRSLERALFTHGTYELDEPDLYEDEADDWADPAALAAEPAAFPAVPWSWHGPAERITGPAWGGCLEIVDFHLRAGRWMMPDDAYDGCVLCLETSEEMPSDAYVYRVLMCLGEYHPNVPLVFGVDFGHTEPQHVLPSGGSITVDGRTRRISVTY